MLQWDICHRLALGMAIMKTLENRFKYHDVFISIKIIEMQAMIFTVTFCGSAVGF